MKLCMFCVRRTFPADLTYASNSVGSSRTGFIEQRVYVPGSGAFARRSMWLFERYRWCLAILVTQIHTWALRFRILAHGLKYWNEGERDWNIKKY